MKKLLFTLAAILMASTAFAGHWVTFEAEDFDYTSGDIFIEKENVVLQGYGRIDYDHFRFYANHSITFTHEDGIMSIEFTCIGEDQGQYGPGNLEYAFEGQRGYYSYEGNLGLWEDGIYFSSNDTFAPYDEDDYSSSETAINPMQTVELNADYQVRCTKIRVYVLDNATPVIPTEQCAKPEGGFENGVDFHGVTVTLVNNETAEGTELHYNITLDGVMIVEDAIYEDAFALTVDGEYYIDFWATAPDMLDSSHGGLIFTIDTTTGLSEVVSGKTVANVRYFNVAGQEMAQPEGMTIVVTTYTDGTTSAAKVVK